MTVDRYPHQLDFRERTMADFRNGYTDLFFVAAMGSGKTTTGCDVVRDTLGPALDRASEATACAAGQRAVWVAHREELVVQAYDRWCALYPELADRAGVVMAGRDECDRQVVFASIQTLASARRLGRLLGHGTAAIAVVDECHHATADSYKAVLAVLREAASRQERPFWHLGMTATAHRTDKRGMVEAGYQKCVGRFGVKEAIQQGVCLPFKAYAIETGISIRSAMASRREGADFDQGELARVMDVDNAHDLIVASYRKYGDGKQFIGFVAGVAVAHALAARFEAAGIPVAAVDGTTDDATRRWARAEFDAGRLRGLINHNVYTEGLDCPTIEVVLWARPTASDLVYLQGAFRGGRRCDHIGKEHFVILDFVPIESRDVVQAGDLLGKPRAQKKLEQQAQKAGVVISAFSFTGAGTGVDGDPDELHARPLRYLSLSSFAWFYHDGLATLGLGTAKYPDGRVWTRVLALTRASDLDGRYRLLRAEWTAQGHEKVVMQGRDDDYNGLADRAIEYAEHNAPDDLTRSGRAWQREPITPTQLRVLFDLMPGGFPPDEAGQQRALSTLTKGEAARLIDHLRCRAVLGRKHQEILALRAAAAREAVPA